MKKQSKPRFAYFALISLAFVVFLGKSYETSLRGIDSNIHAKVAMDVTSKGFLPNLPIPDPNSMSRVGNASFNDHPFFYFWINGWVMRALGPSAWSARILTATASVGCVVMILLLGTLLHSELYGFVSALIFLFTRDIILTGATVSLDPPMLFIILLSFWLWQKQKWPWVGVAAGIGLWIKTPVVLLVFPTALVVSLVRGKVKEEFPKVIRAFGIALGVGSVIWILTGLIGGWQLVGDYFLRQLWGTAVGGRNMGSQGRDWYMFLRLVRNGFLPGLPLLVLGILQIIKHRLWRKPPVLISLTAIGILVLVITPMRFKMDYYLNPVFPFLAFLSAYSVIKVLEPIQAKFFSAVGSGSLVLMSFLLCTPTTLGPEAFVALKRFIPLIQSHGECTDGILLISGDEPIGSSLDYRLVLDFYVGKTVDVETCAAAGITIRKTQPKWVILSRENFDRCLTREEQESFKSRFIVGNQYLLSQLIPNGKEVNLTPLLRELKPVTDCKAPPYPKDIYHRY